MMRRFKGMIAAATVAVLCATACGSHQDPTIPITVYAASSLIKSFTAIGKQFEAANPGYSVEFIFASSSDLASELANGAEADVFASGDRANMQAVSDAGAASGTPVPFATNRLVVVTPAGNPRHLKTFADLAAPGLRVSTCTGDGACGSLTQLAESQFGVHLRSQESEATASRVVGDVTSGRADAGVVFMTNAVAAGNDVSWFAVPGNDDAVPSWITVIAGTAQESAAARFVQQVTGADGSRILGDEGFEAPPKSDH
jgi:molybdate transport system substrate-binding protein